MSLFSKIDTSTNRELIYGWTEESGLFFQVRNLDLPEDSPNFVIENVILTNDESSKENFVLLLDKWDIPREHLLAVILNEDF